MSGPFKPKPYPTETAWAQQSPTGQFEAACGPSCGSECWPLFASGEHICRKAVAKGEVIKAVTAGDRPVQVRTDALVHQLAQLSQLKRANLVA
jgi:hypothetical protein